MPTRRVLMCPPNHFDVAYKINPWMDVEVQPDSDVAESRWQDLRDHYLSLGLEIELIDPVEGLPDMVFTANGGLVIDNRVLLPRFHPQQRRPETPYFQAWFEAAGFDDIRTPEHTFEGEGDALVWNGLVFAGHGFRSSLESHAEIARFFGVEVVSLRLVDPAYYHLDTGLAILDDSTVAVYPAAFDEASLDEVKRRVPTVIEVSPEDAASFGLNAYSDGASVVLASRATKLHAQLEEHGFDPIGVDIQEFRKAGGGVKCLTLDLRSEPLA
jgi:N-dimethylarginine dimethylaminohydrolase